MLRFLQNKWLRRLAVFVGLPIVLIVGFLQWNYPTCTFRYRLTAEVMTPDGLKSGSSVIEVSYSSGHPIPNPGRWSQDTVTGEAVYVDLGGGKNLFVLLGADKWERKASRTPGRQGGFVAGSNSITERQLGEGSLNVLWLPVQVFQLGRKPGKERDMQTRVNAVRWQTQSKDLRRHEPVEVAFKNLPLLGSFADIAKPETFSAVLPAEVSKVLGNGYALKRVTMQIVDDAPRETVRGVLPWLSKESDRRFRKCDDKEQSEIYACQIGTHQLWAKSSKADYIEY